MCLSSFTNGTASLSLVLHHLTEGCGSVLVWWSLTFCPCPLPLNRILSLASFRNRLTAIFHCPFGIKSQKCAACVPDGTKEFGVFSSCPTSRATEARSPSSRAAERLDTDLYLHLKSYLRSLCSSTHLFTLRNSYFSPNVRRGSSTRLSQMSSIFINLSSTRTP